MPWPYWGDADGSTMRILLVQQEMGRRHKTRPVYPIGLAYLTAVLNKKHDVRIFDPNVYSLDESLKRLRAELTEYKPDIVGLSIKYIDTTQRTDPFVFYSTVNEMIRLIEEARPDAKIIVGGPGFSMFSKEIMEDNEGIDFGVYLEAEDSFPELLEHLENPENVKGIFYRRGGRVLFTGSRNKPDFSTLPKPSKDRKIIDVSGYVTGDYRTFGIQSKRGCALKCAYCNYPSLNGRELRLREPKDVVDEIEFMVRHHSLKTFMFADNVFNVPEEHARSICNEIVKRNLKVEWGAWFDLANLSEEMLDTASRAGCRYMDFSPDASTEQGLQALGKRIREKDIDRSIRLLKGRTDIIVSYNFFSSYPGQNLHGVIKTLGLWLKIISTMFGRSRVYVGWVRLEPETPILQSAINEGVISGGENLLAKDSKQLKKLFYTKPQLWYADIIFTSIYYVGEYLAKPIIKSTYHPSKRKYPFYY